MSVKLLPLGRTLSRVDTFACIQQISLVQLQALRRLPTFYNSVSADSLWKSVTTKSNAAKTSPRGKRTSTTKKRDLNRGQILGVGRTNMVWPGLNAPIIKGKELVRQKKLPDDPEREQKLIALRDKMGQFKRIKLSPLERGWSGSSWLGRSFGPPDPIEGQEIPAGLDSRVLELKRVFHMEGKYGRVGTLWSLVFVGNGEGVGGFAVGRGVDNQSSMKRARNRAAQKLMYIERFEDHTVLHDFYSEFGPTKVWAYKKPEGYGLVCHRAIKSMCELLGIKNMYAKVEGTMNYFNITRAFMLGLINQKNFQELADETGLHVVERRKECYEFPKLMASPESPKELPPYEIPDFKLYVMRGVVRNETPKPDLRHQNRGWDRYLRKMQNVRNRTELEFEVDLQNVDQAGRLEAVLKTLNGVKSFEVDAARQVVMVRSDLPSASVQDAVESLGNKAVLKGIGNSSGQDYSEEACAVAQLTCGQPVFGVVRFLQVNGDSCLIDGTIDGLSPGPHGLHIHESGDLSDGCNRLSCGVIARSAGLFQNPKKICDCSGKTLWDERIEAKQQNPKL